MTIALLRRAGGIDRRKIIVVPASFSDFFLAYFGLVGPERVRARKLGGNAYRRSTPPKQDSKVHFLRGGLHRRELGLITTRRS